jgi:hypothetical protein
MYGYRVERAGSGISLAVVSFYGQSETENTPQMPTQLSMHHGITE